MNICIFGAASNKIDDVYMDGGRKLGAELAKKGHTLIFGGGDHGLMGTVARGFKSEGGKIVGIVPEFFLKEKIEDLYEGCDEWIYTKDMAERQLKMEDMADAFIITPGGIGTFEEFFEVLTLKQLKEHNKQIAVFNINGYYYQMEALLHNAIEENFLRENSLKLYKTFECDEMDELIAYVEKKPDDMNIPVSELKYG